MRFFLSALLLVLAEVLSAMTPYKTYSVGDGMPNSTVKAICQDSLGYIWLGTRNGLVRFDGYEFRTYNYDAEAEDAVSSNDITCFTRDKEGRIWIGTFNWITLFDPARGQFVELPFEYSESIVPEGIVTHIWIDPAQRVWVGSKTGLYVIEGDTVRAAKPLLGAYINCMEAIDTEHLLVEIMNKGMALYHISTGQLAYVDEHAVGRRPMIYHIHRDRQGRVWLGADSNHLYEYLPESNSLRPLAIGLPGQLQFNNDQVHDILEYNDSTLILGTDNGMLAIDRDRLTYSSLIGPGLATNTLAGQRIMCLFQDKQDALWVGTFGKGVKYVQPHRYYFCFHEIPTGNGLPAGVVGELIEKDGKLWIGHEQGLSTLDLATGRIAPVALKPQLNARGRKLEVYSLYHNPTDNLLYVHLLNYGLYAFDTEAGKIVKQVGLPPASQVRSMETDRRGHLWIAEEELSVYDPQADELNSFLYTNINNISNFMLTQDLLLRSNGNMLVGTRTSGVWEYPYDETNRNRYSVARQIGSADLDNKNINVLFEDSQGNLWIGTYGSGLFLYDLAKKAMSRYDTSNGLASNSICDIIEDKNTGDMWVATISGISKINPEGRIVNYTNKTGFPLEEVSRKAFLKASDGLFYVGGSNGLASFDPKLFVDSPASPDVVVSLVRPLNQSKGASQYCFDNAASLQRIEVPFKYSSLQIKFSSLNYFFPHGTTYHYMLEGVDEDWNTTATNEAIYTQLHEGKYTFKIKASDNEGHWSDHITEVQLTILPPLWRTAVAKILYVMLTACIVYFLFKSFYDRKTAKYKQQIAQMEKDNLKRYYQMKLDLFTKFSHELRTPLTLITGPTEDMIKDDSLPQKFRYAINLIHKNANRLLLLVNQLMDVRKIEHGAMKLRISRVDLNGFLTEQIENFNTLAQKKDIKLQFSNQYWGKNVWFDTEMMEKVISNLLSNAIKHTPAGGEIVISARDQDNHLLISVRDNGEGIPTDSLKYIFDPFYQVSQEAHTDMASSGIGLNFAKYAVTLHGGKIWAESTLGQGSEFFISLPFGVQHFNEAHTEIVTPMHETPLASGTSGENMPAQTQHGNKTLILVVEDDEELRQYIISLLCDDYSICEASDGKEALDTACEQIPDLIVSDVMMPHMDGIELCRHIKQNASTAHIPVILLTAKVMNESIQEGYEALADSYITKPFDSQVLKARIKNLIDNRAQLRTLFSNQMTTPDVPVKELTRTDPFLEKLFGIVERRIDDPELSINEIAAEMGVSRAQFFRKVKAVSDISPQKLILNIRMKMAVEMLRTREYNISEVAYKVGFNDPTYFSKSFKSVFGMSPTEFLRQSEGEN